ncbi:MAG: lactate dehydrogenase [Lachnospiraceae bacterium]|nr:lactate dehydrogenase [Lachnospiraceae bacterium]
MKIFGYAIREYDEQGYFESICKEKGYDYAFTRDYPSMENAELARGCDCISIITNPMTPQLLDRFYELGVRYISTRSIGYDHIDMEHARKIGMGIAHVTYNPEGVADYSIMMMLMALRKMMPIMKQAELQNYSLRGKLGRQISSCTVGVIGTGKIGTTLIEHLSGFGCKMLAYDLYQNDRAAKFATYTDLETIYRESDIITLHVPGLPENTHMINSDTFAKMKDGVIIINAARGLLIDSDALIDALESGKVGYAALDTVENEAGLYYLNRSGDCLANRQRAILASFPNVLLSPHTAFYTDVAVREMVENSIQGLVNYATGAENPFAVK